jgi:hypothetical protein
MGRDVLLGVAGNRRCHYSIGLPSASMSPSDSAITSNSTLKVHVSAQDPVDEDADRNPYEGRGQSHGPGQRYDVLGRKTTQFHRADG